MAAKDDAVIETGARTGDGLSPCPFPGVVLGIGGPAAETGSLVRVLAGLPLDADLVVVIALQHREALDEDGFRRALGERAGVLVPIADDTPLQAGRIFLALPDLIVTVEAGRFKTRPAERGPGGRATIDNLFVSLGREEDGRSIGLVLAGTGGDGALGLSAIRNAGGFTLAETPGGAKSETDGKTAAETDSGAPAAAKGPAALADFVLPAGEIAERIALHARHLTHRQQAAEIEACAEEVFDTLGHIADVLRERTGHDFHGYKRPTLLRRIQRRMQVVDADRIEDYLDALRARPDEAQQLFNDLLIGVTRFFRDPREFEFLQREVVPKLFEGKGRGDRVRVWVLGCSTGEEVYSIAILLREFAATLDAPPGLQIFATDIDARALVVARVGRYTGTVVQDVPPERLARWFVKEGDTYTVARELRDVCIFSRHSPIKDTPFSRLDLVSCRNVLIYFGTELQDRVIPLFHFALNPGGYLFLGGSESVSRYPKLFAPLDRGLRIFRSIETGGRAWPTLPAMVVDRRVPDAPARSRGGADGLVRRAEHVAERHAPAYTVVDERFDTLHFSAKAGRFIHPTGGVASLNLPGLVHADLRPELEAALQEAARKNEPVEVHGLQMVTDGRREAVNLFVEPVQDAPGEPRTFVVLFKDGVVLPDPADPADTAAPRTLDARDERIRRLEAELRLTRERLQATIEELESTNEELKASNEEYQSLNEELQSANEELATSKEELQSVNEELTTVNYELAQRVQDLDRANSDLKNLLESTQIAAVFLDTGLRVTNFTPAAAEVFHLVETDLGRPIGHIKPRVTYEALQDDARRVLRTLGAVEREVEVTATGARYMARVLPYRSVDDVIAGAVVTFNDITPLSRAQRALRESEARFRGLADLSPDGILIDADGVIRYANPVVARLLGAASPDEVCGRPTLDLVPPDGRDALRERIADARQRHYPATLEIRVHRPDGASIALETVAGPAAWQGKPAVQMLLRDLSERQKAEARQKLLLAELQHRVRNTLAVVRSIARRTAETSETVEGYASHLEGRISSFARTQGMVTRSFDAGVDLEDLVRDELLAHAARDEPHVHVEGPRLRLGPKAAEALGLAVHELATNAVKYGALCEPGGRVSVVWRVEGVDGDRTLQLVWQESGVRPPEAAQRRRGFGTELIERTLQYELGAQTRLEFTPGGVRCAIAVPLTERVLAGGGLGERIGPDVSGPVLDQPGQH